MTRPNASLALALLLVPAMAAAATQRFALLIGNNVGLPSETPLQYAEQDVRRVATILEDLGNLPRANITLLTHQSLNTVRRALREMQTVAVQDAPADETAQTLWFIYYSGHAGADGLHLGDEVLPLAELQESVRNAKAKLKILVVDACRSGLLTRVKGGSRGEPFPITLSEELPGEGVVFISSTAANEAAQEADTIQGSFFSHYWASALLGAADVSGDGRVTLAEAYRYAYDRTMVATSGTLAGVQHPTFEFELRGKGDVVLTNLLQKSASRGRLTIPAGGNCLVMEKGREGAVMAEVSGSQSASLLLTPGPYFIRWRRADHVLEGPVQIRADASVTLSPDSLERLEYARLVRKGDTQTRFAQAPLVHGLWRGEILPGLGSMGQVGVGYQLDFPWFSIEPRLLFGRSTTATQRLHVTLRELGPELRVFRAVDVWRATFGFATLVGTHQLHQSFVGAVTPPARTTWAFVAAIEALASVDLYAGWFLAAEAGGVTYVFPSGNNPNHSETSTPFVARVGVGLGWHL